MLSKEEAQIKIAKRIAREFLDVTAPMCINTGIGIPELAVDYIKNPNIYIHAENGMLGVGDLAKNEQIDGQLINAGRKHVLERAGCAYFDSCESFSMIRGGHLAVSILGAFEVDQEGNIANWIIPDGKQLGVGGAMDLVSGAQRIIVAMQHLDKHGKSRVKKRCTLPITGFKEVELLVTELAVFAFADGRMILREIATGLTVDELRRRTEGTFEVDEKIKIWEE